MASRNMMELPDFYPCVNFVDALKNLYLGGCEHVGMKQRGTLREALDSVIIRRRKINVIKFIDFIRKVFFFNADCPTANAYC